MRSLGLVIALATTLALPSGAGAIVGGTAPTRDYPHMGELRLKGDFICGSSLVRVDWLLTAAHCVEGENPLDYSVHIGSTSRSDGGEVVKVVEGYVHPGYDSNGNDVALLHLERAVKYAPIRLAGPEDTALEQPMVQVTAIGWGATFSEVGSTTDDLREITVPIRTDDECTIGAALVGEYNPETMLCAGETQGGEDTCQGDSGGPLMSPDASGAMVLIGATSFGFGCAYPTQYGVYARISGVRSWIDSQLPAPPAPTQPGATSTPGPSPSATPSPGSSGGGQSSSSQDRRVTLFLPSTLGSAKKARKRRRLEFGIRASGPVSSVKVTLKRGKKVVGRASVTRIVGQTAVHVKVKSRNLLKPGRLSLKVTARDGQNRLVSASGKPRLRP